MAYDNNLSGVLFKNDRKEKDTHPDYQGSCEIEGQNYWISAWIKVGKDGSARAGQKFMSLAFKLKDSQGQTNSQAPARQDNRAVPTDYDLDIPF